MKKILKQTAELNQEQRKELIINLLRQQKRLATFDHIDRDDCSLVDLYNGVIVGSGICPKCSGWIGRAPDYVENSDKK